MYNINKLFSLILISMIWCVAPALAGPSTVTLTGNGTATFTSSPAGINCMISSGSVTGTCSLSGSAQSVTLTATAPVGTLIMWGVNGCSATAMTCSQKLNSNGSLSWLIVVDPSPILGWWTFNDASGTVANDSSGNGDNGTLIGNPAWTTSKIGSSTKGVLSFNGLGQAVTLGNVLQDAYQNLSISCWIKHSGNGWQSIVERSNWSGPDGIGLMTDIGGASVDFGHYNSNGTGYVESHAVVQDNAWHHIVGILSTFTYQSPGYFGTQTTEYRYSIYVDGNLDNTYVNYANPHGLTSTTGGWAIGASYPLSPINASSTSNNYFGNISDIRIYNKALSADEIKRLYSQTVPPAPVIAPTDLRATAQGSPFAIQLQWTPVSGATGYIIKRGPSIGNYTSSFSLPSSANFYFDQTINDGNTYYYEIQAFNSSSVSADSQPIRVVIPPLPSAPKLRIAAVGNGQVTLSWTPSAGATGYTVVRQITPGQGFWAFYPTSTTYTDTGLTNGTTYYYVVSAGNSIGRGTSSNSVTAVPKAS